MLRERSLRKADKLRLKNLEELRTLRWKIVRDQEESSNKGKGRLRLVLKTSLYQKGLVARTYNQMIMTFKEFPYQKQRISSVGIEFSISIRDLLKS